MRQRLQKIIARAGIASRRKAEDLIRAGCVTVNGRLVTELGAQADPEKDHIKVQGRLIRPEPLESYLVHKPRGFLSAASDPRQRPLVTRLVKSRLRLYPAGRLDFNSEGLIILTSDGELAHCVTRAGILEKVYHVKVKGEPSEEELNRLREGITVGGERWEKCRIRLVKRGNNCWYEVALHEGRNRQVRRMFEKIGHPVMRLRRVAIGPLTLGKLPLGGCRKLSAREVMSLKGKKN